MMKSTAKPIRPLVALASAAALAFALTGCAATASSSSDEQSENAGQTQQVEENENASTETEDADAENASPADTQGGGSEAATETAAAHSMTVTVNGAAFTATFEDTQAANEFREMLPLTLDSIELNGNEKYGQLDRSLSTEGPSVVDPIEAGDIFLYGGNDIVLFYQTHSNSNWSYVPIARIDDTTGLADAVGTGSVTISYDS